MIKLWVVSASRLEIVLFPPITEYVDLINLALPRHLKASGMGTAHVPPHNCLLGTVTQYPLFLLVDNDGNCSKCSGELIGKPESR